MGLVSNSPHLAMRRNREPCHDPGERCGGAPFKKHYQRIANNYPSWFSLLEGRPLPEQGVRRASLIDTCYL